LYRSIEKLKILLLVLLVFIGFATGINYYKNINISQISTIKGCFEFGLYPLLESQNFKSIILSFIFSSLKHYFVFLVGMFSWFLFALVPINLFCLSFKFGVSFCCVCTLLSIKGFFSLFFLLIIDIFIILNAIIFSYLILNNILNNWKNHKLNYNYINFIKKSILFLLMFIIVIVIYLCMFKIFNSNLYGLLNTFL